MDRILVIADDFSGAAEMAGIGWSCGLRVSLQVELDLSVTADLIVFDADSRRLLEGELVNCFRSVIEKLEGSSFILFKKIDSVLRGYIVTEATLLDDHFGFDHIVVLPANPSKNRIIRDGVYYVNGIALAHTDFAKDPRFPTRTSLITERMQQEITLTSYRHLRSDEEWCKEKWITSDMNSSDDIRRVVRKERIRGSLYCGGADSFEVFLNELEIRRQTSSKRQNQVNRTRVFLHGSTIGVSQVRNLAQEHHVKLIELTEEHIGPDLELHWDGLELISTLTSGGSVLIIFGGPYKPTYTQVLEKGFVKIFGLVADHIGIGKVHFFVTGGATASYLLREVVFDRLSVVDELAPGVVTLRSLNEQLLITVKPGSYPWPKTVWP